MLAAVSALLRDGSGWSGLVAGVLGVLVGPVVGAVHVHARLLVMITDGPCRLRDELMMIVGLRGSHLTHGELVKDQQVGTDDLTHAAVPSAVRVAAGEIGWHPAGLGEADVGALAMAEGPVPRVSSRPQRARTELRTPRRGAGAGPPGRGSGRPTIPRGRGRRPRLRRPRRGTHRRPRRSSRATPGRDGHSSRTAPTWCR